MRNKIIFLFLIWLVCGQVKANAQAATTQLSLLDGSNVVGRIMSTSVSEVTLLTNFGVLRIPIEKLTAESKASLSANAKPDVDALLRRITELEARIAQLQQENDTLRRGPALQQPKNSSVQSITPPSGTASTQYTVSSTGKRHNSSCRYFGSGRPAGPNDGVACKICGG